MPGITEFCESHPKNILAFCVSNGLGENLFKELDAAGYQLFFIDSLEDYYFSNITADLQRKVDQKCLEEAQKFNKGKKR
jgi:hypothetical protein